MKKPYKFGMLALGGLSIFCGIQSIINFPNWLAPTATSIAGILYVFYLARKDEKGLKQKMAEPTKLTWDQLKAKIKKTLRQLCGKDLPKAVTEENQK